MKEQLKELDMVAGKEYKGYGWRNSYGEFFFRPCAVGSRAGRLKKVCEDSDYGLATTKEYVLIRIKLPRQKNGPMAYVSALTKVVDKLLQAFLKYEI